MSGSLSTFNGNSQRGFSLVELMVGVLVGLIGMVVIFQVMSVWDTRKRTTAAGGDAQISGSVALFHLERDVKLTGFGFARSNFMGCDIQVYDSTLTAPANTFAIPMVPVRIVRTGAAGANPVQIYTLRGASATFAAEQTFSGSTDTTKTAKSRGGMLRGDLLVIVEDDAIARPGQHYCAMVEFTDDSVAGGIQIGHATGSYATPTTPPVTVASRFNAAGGPPNLPATFTAGVIHNLGNRDLVRWNLWQLRGTALTVADQLHYVDANGDGQNDWQEIADNIIDFQAQYGFDLDDNKKLEVENPDPDTANGEWRNDVPPAPVDWKKLRAIRVAVLARSQQYEKEAVTTVRPKWAGGDFVMKNVDGTADSTPGDANDWRRYRYRVYEMVIPLRNVVWGAL